MVPEVGLERFEKMEKIALKLLQGRERATTGTPNGFKNIFFEK
jgi:hypothetical protein